MLDDATFLAQFEAAAFPPDQWRHREHIRIAYLYLSQHPFDVAVDKIRFGIKALNAAHKTPETIDRGYHETITLGWSCLVNCAIQEFGPGETADAFLDKHTQLLSKRALFFFYSRDLLMSPEAKQSFVEPDLAPLPQSRKELTKP